MRVRDRGNLRRWIAAALSAGALQLAPAFLPLPALAPPDPSEGGTGSLGVRTMTTGNHSERIKRLPITRRPGAGERVVMSLGPDQLPALRAGDRLRMSAEAQVSTTCLDPGRRCVGRRYAFNPRVSAKLVLARNARTSRGPGAKRLVQSRSVGCRQRLPHRNHHCTIVFPSEVRRIGPNTGLPCEPRSCHLNLVMQADNRRARRGNVLVVGGDRPNGRIVQDKGRLNATLVRQGAIATRERLATHRRLRKTLPLEDDGSVGRRVLYSLRLPDLAKGDRIVVRGEHRTALKTRRRNAYVASELILAARATATEPGRASRLAPFARATETNGFNCTHGRSGYRTPCRSPKAGVLRIVRDPGKVLGDGAVVRLNLVARALALRSQAKPHHRVRITSGGGLEAIRYSRPG